MDNLKISVSLEIVQLMSEYRVTRQFLERDEVQILSRIYLIIFYEFL